VCITTHVCVHACVLVAQAYLSAEASVDTSVVAATRDDVFLREYVGDDDNERSSATSVWEVELSPAGTPRGGPVVWEKGPPSLSQSPLIRLRHAASGRYLVWSEDGSQLSTVVARQLASPVHRCATCAHCLHCALAVLFYSVLFCSVLFCFPRQCGSVRCFLCRAVRCGGVCSDKSFFRFQSTIGEVMGEIPMWSRVRLVCGDGYSVGNQVQAYVRRVRPRSDAAD
jgi:hypothetical protein